MSRNGAGGLLALAPLRIEARAVRAGAPAASIVRTGMGPERSTRAAAAAALLPGDAVAVIGFCGALDRGLEPGDIVVATELREADRTVPCAGAELIAGMLRRRGLTVHAGPVACSDRIVTGDAREELRATTGAIAADMESAWLAPAAAGRPLAVVRVVVDGPVRELLRPVATATGAARAYRTLSKASAVLDEWAAAVAPREVVLAGPRASCAGVDRAIDIVERALERFGPPIYVRKQIVHNIHVVRELEGRGAVFVDELDAVPDGARVVFSAHGVSPAVREVARSRNMNVIDATCPLVAKVHGEARRFAARGYEIVLIGHGDHEEVEGTLGEVPPGQMHLVADAGEVDDLEVADPERVAYLTQTTLAVDETAQTIAALRRRFPAIVGPNSDDICYATQNRQDAVRAVAADCDVVLVVGSQNSSNSNRLVEVAERAGARAWLIEDESEIEPAWLKGATRVGLTAGASARESLVQRVLGALEVLGPVETSERTVTRETTRFKLPVEVRETTRSRKAQQVDHSTKPETD